MEIGAVQKVHFFLIGQPEVGEIVRFTTQIGCCVTKTHQESGHKWEM